MDIQAKIKAAMGLITTGRQALQAIADSVADGTAIMIAGKGGDTVTLNKLIADEPAETEAAFNNLQAAIDASRR